MDNREQEITKLDSKELDEVSGGISFNLKCSFAGHDFTVVEKLYHPGSDRIEYKKRCRRCGATVYGKGGFRDSTLNDTCMMSESEYIKKMKEEHTQVATYYENPEVEYVWDSF